MAGIKMFSASGPVAATATSSGKDRRWTALFIINPVGGEESNPSKPVPRDGAGRGFEQSR